MSASKEKESEQSQRFISHFDLKDYKSINHAKIDFKPGLNIIIGKNGSGKTNFMQALHSAVNLDFDSLPNSNSKIKGVVDSNSFEIESIVELSTHFSVNGDMHGNLKHHYKLKINDEEIGVNSVGEMGSELLKNEWSGQSNLISHGIPYFNTNFVQTPISMTILGNGGVSRELMSQFLDQDNYFLKNYFFLVYANLYTASVNKDHQISAYDIHQKILKSSEDIFSDLNQQLNAYSPIQSIRLNPDFRVSDADSNSKINLINFYLEFKVNNEWQVFNFLSDGTKRLFYIISEFIQLADKQLGVWGLEQQITLLEEPELGIHPHQLHQLMLFIKEQSREKQTIITTHSPQVLDILGPDELDRIIICDYNQQKGTQLHHLTDAQIKKAKLYMEEEGFLSDYWRFSDLEPV